jgi:hypothetical protein
MPIESTPLTRGEVDLIKKAAVGLVGIIAKVNQIDASRGQAKTEKGKLVWRKDGVRIDIESVGYNGFIISAGRKPDPDAPASGTHKGK